MFLSLSLLDDRSGELPRNRSFRNHDNILLLGPMRLASLTAGWSCSHADILDPGLASFIAFMCSESLVPPTVCRRRFRFSLFFRFHGSGDCDLLFTPFPELKLTFFTPVLPLSLLPCDSLKFTSVFSDFEIGRYSAQATEGDVWSRREGKGVALKFASHLLGEGLI